MQTCEALVSYEPLIFDANTFLHILETFFFFILGTLFSLGKFLEPDKIITFIFKSSMPYSLKTTRMLLVALQILCTV